MTGSHIKIKSHGDKCLGITLEGNPKKPEPDEFRVVFPGGIVNIVRTTDNDYWVHVSVDHEKSGWYNTTENPPARMVDARLDIVGRNSSDVDLGEFADDNLYNLAVRVSLKP